MIYYCPSEDTPSAGKESTQHIQCGQGTLNSACKQLPDTPRLDCSKPQLWRMKYLTASKRNVHSQHRNPAYDTSGLHPEESSQDVHFCCVLTAGIESLSIKTVSGLFLAFEKGPSHSASAVRQCWQRQAHLSALLWLTAKQIKGLKTSDCGWQNWSQRQAFTCQIISPCDAIKHYGS